MLKMISKFKEQGKVCVCVCVYVYKWGGGGGGLFLSSAHIHSIMLKIKKVSGLTLTTCDSSIAFFTGTSVSKLIRTTGSIYAWTTRTFTYI